MDNIISVIVPIYRGNKHIPNIYIMMINNCMVLKKKFLKKIELILVNDCPEEKIDWKPEISNEDVILKIIQTDINRGIHSARVRGLKLAQGKYILFLDQDDKIKNNYLLSQLNILKEGYDAVVCNGVINKYKKRYVTHKEQQEVQEVDSYIKKGNQIKSPGQVLLKRRSIPEEWINNTLKNNGADDYMLWVIMLKKNKIFAINQEVIFYHNSDRNQNSVTDFEMDASTRECLDILVGLKIIEEEEKKEREFLIDEDKNRREKNKDDKAIKLQEMYIYTSRWLKNKILNYSVQGFFYNRNYYKIAIYGASYLGDCLYRELRDSKVEVVCFVDKSADIIWDYEVKIFRPEEELPEIDALIVTSIYYIEQIKEIYKNRLNCPIHSLKEVIDYMGNIIDVTDTWRSY